MRRYKFEKINLKIVAFVILFIFFLAISVGYSYLQQQLNIYGKSTIVTDDSGKYLLGNSKYSYKIVDVSEREGTNYKIYNIEFNIVNLDNDLTSWQIAFDVPQGYSDTMSSVETNLSKAYKNGRLTISEKNNNGFLSKGSTVKFNMKMAINGEFSMDKVTLNGKLASITK